MSLRCLVFVYVYHLSHIMRLSVHFEIEIWLEISRRSSQQQQNKSSDMSLAGLGKFMLQVVEKKS
jgi:hypothetical protein